MSEIAVMKHIGGTANSLPLLKVKWRSMDLPFHFRQSDAIKLTLLHLHFHKFFDFFLIPCMHISPQKCMKCSLYFKEFSGITPIEPITGRGQAPFLNPSLCQADTLRELLQLLDRTDLIETEAVQRECWKQHTEKELWMSKERVFQMVGVAMLQYYTSWNKWGWSKCHRHMACWPASAKFPLPS